MSTRARVMRCAFFWVDAFTPRVFGGNPAGVCLLEQWLDDARLQQIAWQNGLAETAFLVPLGAARHHLRWFTPEVEIDLCGHATLAAAHVLWRERQDPAEELIFTTRSGPLTVRRGAQERLVLDFPARPAKPVSDAALTRALRSALPGVEVEWVGQARDTLVVVSSADAVRTLQPDLGLLEKLDTVGVIVSARGDDCDFVSRFFAPRVGVPEDPVTGSAHCTLVPYWSGVLGRTVLHARQVSRRGGELWCEHVDDRVLIGGQAVTYLRGELDGL